MIVKNNGSPICPMCKRLATKLVPMQDTGLGEKVCYECKKAIKKGLPIKKFGGKR